MKAFITLILVTLFATPVSAGDWKWDRGDTACEVVAAGLTVIDWGQTRDIRNHKGKLELNPILGPTPSNAAVDNYFGMVLLLHPLISAALPKQADLFGIEIRPRQAWQYFYIGVESTAISSNYRGGLRMSF